MTKLAVFIDADNFSDCTALDHAMEAVRGLGEHTVFKHAYGNAKSLKSIEVVLGKYGIRPISNLVVGKTTTDVALAIGAIEAICRNPDIRVAVICSGDADFAPLAIRLHELGCKAICIGLHGIIFRSADAFYDEVIEIKVIDDTDNAEVAPPRSLPVLSPCKALPETCVAPSEKNVTGSGQANQFISVRPAESMKAMVSVKQVLKAFPALKNGEWVAMSVVVRTLREAQVIAAKAALKDWLSPIQAHFEVELIAGKKNQIRYKTSLVSSSTSAPQSAITTQHLLQVCPSLVDQQWVPLGLVVKGLRDRQHISPRTKLKGWLPPLSLSFEWQPLTAPNQIRWRGQ